MSRLVESMRLRAQRKNLLETELERQRKRLIKLDAKKIILFGSLASGHVKRWSDLDLLVIMPSSRTAKEWMRVVHGDIDGRVACDIIVFNEDEFRDNLPSSSFLREVIERGVVIYER
ncbi:MAG: nucleotidyltransferase domain-containing protein [Candidatus Thorarchaeota archaeon]